MRESAGKIPEKLDKPGDLKKYIKNRKLPVAPKMLTGLSLFVFLERL